MNHLAAKPDPNQAVYWLIISKDKILLPVDAERLPLLAFKELTHLQDFYQESQYIGQLEGQACFSLDLESHPVQMEGWCAQGMRDLLQRVAEQYGDLSVVAKAWQYALFKRTHRYCGQCGSPMVQIDWEMARQCQRCSHRCYPRISPCVIVAIRKGKQILLAQGESQKQRNMHSVLAGFVESGESLEQAVHREVMEEVGIRIKNLVYFSSQAWPFPHSLMVGYTAEYDQGEIQVDGKEILNAGWYHFDQLPNTPPTVSIAGQMIAAIGNQVSQK